ncbi:MAG: aminoacyl-tRNA hydrolase [Burkholderiales bacterium]|nr:aminoacyl-tRNA hydrolase [Phycisphaerae bacterium]
MINMKLIVGLGNPGSEYIGTRHNIGFEVLDRLAQKLGWIAEGGFDRMAKSKFDGLTIDGLVNLSTRAMEKLLLLKPATYMNLSGRSVQQAVSFYQLTPDDVMIVLDDLALPCGKLRLRGTGSSGGHNGLKDIEKMLGTTAYPRLRIGIDAPPQYVPGKDYVLGKWSTEQREKVTPAIDRACGAILTWADNGIDKAMSAFNTAEI